MLISINLLLCLYNDFGSRSCESVPMSELRFFEVKTTLQPIQVAVLIQGSMMIIRPVHACKSMCERAQGKIRKMLRFPAFLLLSLAAVQCEKVDVRFYGEALCPDCAYFTNKVLQPIFKSGICSIIDFRYIGWGNVQRLGGSYQCQHGPLECTMNTVLNCGQELSANQNQFFDFLFCIESQAGPDVKQQIPGCAKAAGLELNPLEKCYKGARGRELDNAAMEETNGLNPPHTYVPWVTVNGQPLYDDTDLLATYICDAYKGGKPAACSKPSRQFAEPVVHVS